jgi:hypothetical protein
MTGPTQARARYFQIRRSVTRRGWSFELARCPSAESGSIGVQVHPRHNFAKEDRPARGTSAPRHRTEGDSPVVAPPLAVGIITIIVIVLIVLLVLGFVGRSRF